VPFPNEHAARQEDPGNFTRFRRMKPKGFPAGVGAIIGIRANGKSAIQSIRFDRKKWTPEKARKWLKDHQMKTSLEVASGPAKVKKDFWSNVL